MSLSLTVAASGLIGQVPKIGEVGPPPLASQPVVLVDVREYGVRRPSPRRDNARAGQRTASVLAAEITFTVAVSRRGRRPDDGGQVE